MIRKDIKKISKEEKNGEINRIRRYYICECILCGKKLSVRGENLISGNTKGCGCDMYKKGSATRHNNHLNRYEYDYENNCWKGFSTNSDSCFLFDDCDYDLISKYCWYETREGYMMTRISKNEQIFLHRFLLFGLDSKNHLGTMVDHINRCRLDNRRSNLRKCSSNGNARNCSPSKNSISGVVGVGWNNQRNCWRAYITENGKYKDLGNFKSLDDAIEARMMAAERLYGEFAPK